MGRSVTSARRDTLKSRHLLFLRRRLAAINSFQRPINRPIQIHYVVQIHDISAYVDVTLLHTLKKKKTERFHLITLFKFN